MLADAVVFSATVATTLAAEADAWKLPAEKTVLADGPARPLVVGQCLLCHSADYISTQPRLTRAQWTATLDKMRAKFGAPLPEVIPLLTRVVADAVADGLMARAGRAAAAEAGEVAVDEPLAEWETELLAGSNDAATPEVAPAQAAAE